MGKKGEFNSLGGVFSIMIFHPHSIPLFHSRKILSLFVLDDTHLFTLTPILLIGSLCVINVLVLF